MRPNYALVALTLSAFLVTPTRADTPLPATLTGTLTNPADQTITFGAPSVTSSLTVNSGASLTNLGTWNAYTGTIAPNGSFITPTYSGSILNTGTLTIDASAGPLTIQDFPPPPQFETSLALPFTFTNTGNINLLAGTFNLAASDTGNSSGTITLGANTTLGLAANLTFDANSSLTGSGNILMSTNIRIPTGHDYIPNATNTPPAITFNGNYNTTGNTTIIGESVTFNTNTTLNNLQITTGTVANGVTSQPRLGGSGNITLNGAGTFQGLISWTGGPSISGATISVPSLLVTGTLSLNTASSGTSTIDGTAITVQPGAALFLNAPQSAWFHFKNHATIVNNGLIVANAVAVSDNGSPTNHSVAFTNNGTFYVSNHFTMGGLTEFNNNGTINVIGSLFELGPYGTESDSSVINLRPGTRMFFGEPRSLYHGTLNNAGGLQIEQNITLGTALVLHHTGWIQIDWDTLVLAAPQQSDDTGTFQVESISAPGVTIGTLEFAANYDFSSPTGPSFVHYASGDGLLIIDPGFTLTLPSDTAFAGTVEALGTLIIAPPLNPADAGLAPKFTVVTPEPASLALLTLAVPLLLRRVRSSALRR